MKLNEKDIKKKVKEGKRHDGRDLEEYRDIEIETDYIHETAEGSAKVSIGDTQVVVGVSTEVEEPYDDRPESGTIVTNAELAPMADREFESGPPQEDGVELARVVDRGIRESEAIDLQDLCIEPGEKVYTLFIDVHVLNNDGNLIDASSLAAMAALKSGYLPEYDEDEGQLDRDSKWKDIELSTEPVTATARMINGELVFDTTKDEEEALDARMTVSIDENDQVVAMQKGEIAPYSTLEIVEAMEKVRKKTSEFRELLEEAVE
ncbi:exosome complex protein Rrp42 [Candidatus Nanosalina sp. VS9-1]|uniref:exosome complex protein Rrp42 n=1 Tax=Candidatus Nanosalina sp. VS9-1 TaxID=3388566 RepID=UPI0039E0597F